MVVCRAADQRDDFIYSEEGFGSLREMNVRDLGTGPGLLAIGPRSQGIGAWRWGLCMEG